MKENGRLKILKSKTKNIEIDTEESQLLLLYNKLNKQQINIPNDESIKILLENEDVKNLIMK